MARNWLQAFNKHSLEIELAFAAFTVALFLFSLADWLDLIAYEGYQPRRMVFLSAAIALQPIAALVRRRWTGPSYVLLAGSMVLLAGSFVVAN